MVLNSVPVAHARLTEIHFKSIASHVFAFAVRKGAQNDIEDKGQQ